MNFLARMVKKNWACFFYFTPLTKKSANCAIIGETAIPKDVPKRNPIIDPILRYNFHEKISPNFIVFFIPNNLVKLRLVIKKEIAVIQRCLKCLECSKNCC